MSGHGSVFIPIHRLDPDRVVRSAQARFDQGHDIVEIRSHLPLRFFCLRHPEQIAQVYAHPKAGRSKPPQFLRWANFFMGDGLFNDLGSDGGATWSAKRKVMIKLFTQGAARKYVRYMDEAVEARLSAWSREGLENGRIDAVEQMRLIVSDFSHRVLFGTGAGGLLADFNRYSHWAEENFSNLLPVSIPTPTSLRFRKARRWIRDHFRGQLRKPPSGLDRDCVARGLQPLDLSEEEKLDQLFSVAFGVSALSVALAWHLYLVGRHPKSQADVAGADPEDHSSSSPITRVSDECMRYLGPFFGSLRYAREPIEIQGHRFPARSTFLLLRFHAQRHPAFWDRPDDFDPDRFLATPKATLPNGTFVPFGYGSRTCLGAHLASPALKTAYSRIVREFELGTLADAPWPELVDFRYGVFPRQPIPIQLRKRSTHELVRVPADRPRPPGPHSHQDVQGEERGEEAQGVHGNPRCPFSGVQLPG